MRVGDALEVPLDRHAEVPLEPLGAGATAAKPCLGIAAGRDPVAEGLAPYGRSGDTWRLRGEKSIDEV
jgi:hypothetical protein